jgi:hypothetical protein
MTRSALSIRDDTGIRAGVLAAGKDTVAHVKVDLNAPCPKTNRLNHNCLPCDYTDRVGYCCYPVLIQDEIKAGLVRPDSHDWNFPERDRDLQRRAEALAFRDVDRR